MSSAPKTINLYRPTFAEVDLDAFRRNVGSVAAMLPESSRMIAVLKADAYGHGAVELARVCESEKVGMLAVALVEEALEIKNAGVSLPILILGPLDKAQLIRAIHERFVIGIIGPEELMLLDAITMDKGLPVRIHLKLDSGMNRMGLKEEDLDLAVAVLERNRFIHLDAIYTHFANASDPDDPFTAVQVDAFHRMTEHLRTLGIEAPLQHAANSAATVRRLVKPGDYARVGIVLFGGESLDSGESRLEPILTLRSRVARIKRIEPGDSVGYGTTFTASEPMTVATIPVGYADGYNRALSNRGTVLIRGMRAPVIGRVSMDLITVDVTEFPVVEVGDPVTLIGRNGNEEVSAEEIAQLLGTISYEVFCAISSRIPRLYRSADELRVTSKFADDVGELE